MLRSFSLSVFLSETCFQDQTVLKCHFLLILSFQLFFGYNAMVHCLSLHINLRDEAFLAKMMNKNRVVTCIQNDL